MSRPVPRYAAAVTTIAVLVSAVWILFGGGGQVAFADLIKPILEAKSAKFKVTVQAEGEPPYTAETMVLEPARVRQEQPNGSINIMDFGRRKWVMLHPTMKMAFVYELANLPKGQGPVNYFDHLRTQLREAQEEPNARREVLGDEEIEGRRAIGYRITTPARVTVIWGDPETRLPIRIETTSPLMGASKLTWSDFEFNVDLDESLFSLDVPADYEVRSASMDYSPLEEKDLIGALRGYSDVADGDFPDTLPFDTKVIVGLLKRLGLGHGEVPTDKTFKEASQLSITVGRGLGFALQLLPEANAHYAGKGVKRGTPDAPIFWYLPKGSDTYRVIYADLSVRDADTAPSVRGTQRVPTGAGKTN